MLRRCRRVDVSGVEFLVLLFVVELWEFSKKSMCEGSQSVATAEEGC